jgi:hypothetical protein
MRAGLVYFQSGRQLFNPPMRIVFGRNRVLAQLMD